MKIATVLGLFFALGSFELAATTAKAAEIFTGAFSQSVSRVEHCFEPALGNTEFERGQVIVLADRPFYRGLIDKSNRSFTGFDLQRGLTLPRYEALTWEFAESGNPAYISRNRLIHGHLLTVKASSHPNSEGRYSVMVTIAEERGKNPLHNRILWFSDIPANKFGISWIEDLVNGIGFGNRIAFGAPEPIQEITGFFSEDLSHRRYQNLANSAQVNSESEYLANALSFVNNSGQYHVIRIYSPSSGHFRDPSWHVLNLRTREYARYIYRGVGEIPGLFIFTYYKLFDQHVGTSKVSPIEWFFSHLAGQENS